jgi:hypothetical protein
VGRRDSEERARAKERRRRQPASAASSDRILLLQLQAFGRTSDLRVQSPDHDRAKDVPSLVPSNYLHPVTREESTTISLRQSDIPIRKCATTKDQPILHPQTTTPAQSINQSLLPPPSLPLADLALPLTPSSIVPRLSVPSVGHLLVLVPISSSQLFRSASPESHSSELLEGGPLLVNVGKEEKTCADRPCAAEVVSSMRAGPAAVAVF